MAIQQQAFGDTGRPYSQALAVSGGTRTIYISGQLARASLTEARHHNRLGDQAREIFTNIEALLAEAGATMADVVKITAFVTTLEGYEEYSRIRREVFTDPLPASSTVQVTSLVTPGCLIEIEAVAVV